ncbi:hypothetical protein ACO2JO_01170 [Leptospira interrogans]
MPTNRTRIKRTARSRVTDQAREIFAEAIALQTMYHDCSREGGTCRSTSLNQRCGECVNYINLSQELGGLLGLKPWETCPLDVDRESPPDWLRNNLDRSGHWRKAWAMRCELEAE